MLTQKQRLPYDVELYMGARQYKEIIALHDHLTLTDNSGSRLYCLKRWHR